MNAEYLNSWTVWDSPMPSPQPTCKPATEVQFSPLSAYRRLGHCMPACGEGKSINFQHVFDGSGMTYGELLESGK